MFCMSQVIPVCGNLDVILYFWVVSESVPSPRRAHMPHVRLGSFMDPRQLG